MVSSDEEGEILPECITDYHVVNSHDKLISFSLLPLHWSGHEDVIGNGDVSVAFLLGAADGGLQSVYKEVIGWKLELSDAVPEVYMLSKGKTWIQLQKPRKGYEYTIKSVLIVARCLHFAKRNLQAARNEISSYVLKTLSSDDLIEPLEKRLSDHLTLIRSAVANDEDLAKSKIDNPGRSETLHEDNPVTNKSKFIVSDEDSEDEDESEGVFDSVCAFCDNGGDVLPHLTFESCEGQCMRSFHPTIEAGVDTCCESIGFENAAQYEVFPCVSATCGHFYHPECVANLLCPTDETLASQLKSQIAAGKSFTCPIHKCQRCQGGENRDGPEFQFAVCRRCPKAYHRRCLPKKIAFKGSADGTIQQRAWDDLLPKRILMKHKIVPDIWTPKRNHICFPSIVWKRNQEGRRTKMMSERRSNAFGNFRVIDTEKMPKVVERQFDSHLW
ncbi:hypothetical protein L1987_55435 [Smallanthus sonchifolius]|uniref:Uncharacterized protein n=1 Tax=Smallanthus sonchifolius TaxID=185202 RepID=A0ACB9EA84_9ASTR|nr:hypothetical protein L1987_55435 [Smallanthus sonchifolius]